MKGRVPFMAGLTRELPGAEKEAGAGIGKVAPERRTEAETYEAATGPPVTAGQYQVVLAKAGRREGPVN